MLSKTRARLTAVAGAAVTALGAGLLAPVQPAFAASFVPIAGAGSTWSYTAIHDWITEMAQFGVTVNYADIGSSTGRSDFAAGTVDFAVSDIPYGVQDGNNQDPPPSRGYAYLPDVAGGLAFAYNLHIAGQQVTNLRLSGATIAGIFTNKITTWNDPAIAADNPGLTLPAERITPVVRSDGSGASAVLTQWMLATEPSYWTAYCAVVGRNPCTQTSSYPVQPGTAMVGQSGDVGVGQYVAQPQAEGAIGYVQYSYAQELALPSAKVLNAAGYYTLPTPGNVAVSLLNAQFDTNPSDPLYLTANLSQVYTDTDPRAYELSSYSYLIVPTDSSDGLTSAKGFTLGFFGSYLLCQGQEQVDLLGYSALPVGLVQDGYAQLQRIPGNQVATPTTTSLQSCNSPAYSSDGTNALADNDPQPPACDQQGPTQCGTTTTTGGPVGTQLTLTSSPSEPSVGQTVTLIANVLAADGSHPAGSVQFMASLTAIGSPVPVAVLGAFMVASTSTAFAATGFQPVSAVFTPTNTTGYTSSTGTLSEFVVPVGAVPGAEPVVVSVPAVGSFTLTVATGTVTLSVSGSSATGVLNPVTVSDTRNSFPGWSVMGQESAFDGSGTAAGYTFSGNQLGWVPTEDSRGAGVTLGATVSAGTGALGSTGSVLAQAIAPNGSGTSVLGANLTLAIPGTAAAGPYTGTLTITAVTSLL